MNIRQLIVIVAWIICIGLPVRGDTEDKDVGDPAEKRCRARYFAAMYGMKASFFEDAASLCRDVISDKPSTYTGQAKLLLGEALFRLGDYRSASSVFHEAENRFQEAVAFFHAGDYDKAKELFDAESRLPARRKVFDCPVGKTPEPVRAAIWSARCLGRLGKKSLALETGYRLIADNQSGWWGDDDQILGARTMLENLTGDRQEVEKLKQFGEKIGQRYVKSYFTMLNLVATKDAKGLVRYLTRSDVPISPVEPAVWRKEAMELGADLVPEMVQYMAAQLEEAAQGKRTELNINNLHQLMELVPYGSLVKVSLGSLRLKRNFPNGYIHWLEILRNRRQECRDTILDLLHGKRDEQMLGLDLLNEFEIYDRETLDVVASIAPNEFYPTQVQALLAFWRVSGQVFGLEGKDTSFPRERVSDEERRAALKRAVNWWKNYASEFSPQQVIPVNPQKESLLAGLHCRLGNIYWLAAEQLAKSGDVVVLQLGTWPRTYVNAMFFHDPQPVVEFWLRYKRFSNLEQATGVSFPNRQEAELDQAWRDWWAENKAAYDFDTRKLHSR